MKNFIQTLKNIWKIDDLRNRIIATLGFVLVYRVGAHIVLPGIDPTQLSALSKQTDEGIMSILNMFSGGAFANASIFALGIMPYITASIIVQLLGMAIPYFQRLQREGESGHRKINRITRYLTVAVLLIQAPSYVANLRFQLPSSAFLTDGFWGFNVPSYIILTAGTMFIMWLGERITDKGIGNGISLLIMIGIIARFPFAVGAEFVSCVEEVAGGGLIVFIVELVMLFLVFVVSILLVQGVRKIPVQYAKRIVGNKQYGGVRQYLPLKVNAAGVMPIIFAQALMFIPLMFTRFNSETTQGIAAAFADFTGFWYNFTYALLIIVFTYFYTAITFSPQQMADDMKKKGGFIPGVKPGKATVDKLDEIMSRITLPGAIFLAIIGILPVFAITCGVNNQFAQFYGGTSLLILVGVILDTLMQIESHLLMRHYDGLMKSGRIKGRAGSGM
ncbi:MAG: preprotein translocase subunit SecY [Bacteroidales bacterium]|nr:preprotein translocase subunit SecY [Bacteroidales bacterium]MBP5502688.1 preprotein translocase subunit SecY [Bacteroidales bacterium]